MVFVLVRHHVTFNLECSTLPFYEESTSSPVRGLFYSSMVMLCIVDQRRAGAGGD